MRDRENIKVTQLVFSPVALDCREAFKGKRGKGKGANKRMS